ncbi:neutrophil defensin 4-like [Piliocolobus tephrosceles]|uniref:Neutrophil defensin 4-like n=1 Tax=Piliocolobus tephrosceles TaxID=591936 RepID=A0A8C9H2T3_9PRIM|nr:neutrophil defensin 4-like [Piliocolobus tephrosceles]
MRTLALLAAILLVALQAQAESLQARAADQEQPRADDQEVVDSFAWDESATLQVSGSTRALACICRRYSCRPGELRRGTCSAPGVRYLYCCR